MSAESQTKGWHAGAIDARKPRDDIGTHERRLLRLIAGDTPLRDILDDLCRTLQSLASRPLRCAVLLADEQNDRLTCISAPAMPASFRQDGSRTISTGNTACARATRSRMPVIVADIDEPGLAEDVLRLRREYAYGAVWSHPILQDGRVLGTLAFLPDRPGVPGEDDTHLIEFGVQVARLALAHEHDIRALRESEQRFRDYADMAADWYWEQDAEFRFTKMSGGIFNKGGFRVADSIGKTRWELPIEGMDEAQWAAHRARLERHEPFQDFTYRVRAADNRLHWYAVSGKPVFDATGAFLGYRGTGKDITALVAAQLSLAHSEANYRQLLQRNPLPVWIFDPETLQLLEVSRGACALTGYGREELLSRRVIDMRPREEQEAFRQRIRQGIAGDHLAIGQWPTLRKDGSRILTRISWGSVDYAGRPAISAFLQDVTEQVQAELQIRELNDRLEERVKARTAELEAVNQELDAFNHSVSHDLRAPLRAVEGFNQALLEDHAQHLDETGRDYLRRTHAAAQRMGKLIDAMYHLSRLGRSMLQLRKVNLSALAGQAVAELRQADPSREVEVAIEADLLAEGDPDLLRAVLANLLGNAWKYTALTPSARIAFGREADDAGNAVFCVRDNGAGFDMRFAEKLFKLFQRLHRDEEFGGHGVGLAIVQRIVRRHGGRIWAEAEKGRGAVFRFTLWDNAAVRREAEAALQQLA